jgi:chromosome segregation ATPase
MTEDDLYETDQAPDTVFEGLKPSTTRTESVDMGLAAEKPSVDFQPLNSSSTSYEDAGPANATPLVVLEDDDGPSEPTDSETRTIPELLGEVRSLVSRNQILRTERTSMAGRKYALEKVIETLREKLVAVADLCERLDAPGELGEALREIREMVGDARRIADDQSVLEADLESERAKHLDDRQRADQKISELNEKIAGIRSERNTLRSQVTRVERERLALQAQLDEERKSVSEVEGQAVEQLESYMEQMQELEERVGTLDGQLTATRAARDEALAGLEEAVAHSETIATANAELEIELRDAKQDTSKLDEAQVTLETTQADLDTAKSRLNAAVAKGKAAEARLRDAESERDAARAKLGALEDEVAKRKATMKEQRKALLEMKPILEDWGKLEKENSRLSRLVGEARERGRVNINELMARAALLKRLEKLTSEEADY